MSTTLSDPAVRAYLDELRRLLGDAPDRELVVEGVARHIEDALGVGPADPAAVRAVLDDLGDPGTIAAEASADAVERPRTPFLERRAGAILDVLVLTFGGLILPGLGWVVGLGLVWTSRLWGVRDKLLGTLAPVAASVLLALLALLVQALSGNAVHVVHLGLVLGLVVGFAYGAVHLLRTAHPRD